MSPETAYALLRHHRRPDYDRDYPHDLTVDIGLRETQAASQASAHLTKAVAELPVSGSPKVQEGVDVSAAECS